jgi:hypothetical protein
MRMKGNIPPLLRILILLEERTPGQEEWGE